MSHITQAGMEEIWLSKVADGRLIQLEVQPGKFAWLIPAEAREVGERLLALADSIDGRKTADAADTEQEESMKNTDSLGTEPSALWNNPMELFGLEAQNLTEILRTVKEPGLLDQIRNLQSQLQDELISLHMKVERAMGSVLLPSNAPTVLPNAKEFMEPGSVTVILERAQMQLQDLRAINRALSGLV